MNSSWTAVLSDGKVSIHQIEDTNSNDKRFPQNNNEKPISHIAITEDFLLMVDTQGKLKYYLMEDNSIISEHRSQNPITKVFPNKSGSKCICIDNTGNGYFFNVVDDTMLFVPNFQAGTTNILWDIEDPNIFVTINNV